MQLYSGGAAQVERRPQDWDGYPPRHHVAGLQACGDVRADYRRGLDRRGLDWRGRYTTGSLHHEADHMREGGKVTQFDVVVALDAVGLPHRGEQLGLLDGVHTEVCLQVQVQVQHVLGIARLLRHQGQNPLTDLALSDRGRSLDRRRGLDWRGLDCRGLDWRGLDRHHLDRRGSLLDRDFLHDAQLVLHYLDMGIRVAAGPGQPVTPLLWVFDA